jgi:integrase/recombinase XerD
MDGRMEMWSQWMRATGATDKTISTRLKGIRALCAHANTTNPCTLTTMDIIAWLADCHSQWTRRTYCTTARMWHRWLVEQGIRGDDPTATIPITPQPGGVARPAASEAIHDVLEHSGRRTRAYITLATYEGLRCFEIAKLRGEDFNDGWLWVAGKGGQPAALPIHPMVKMLQRGFPVNGFWFPGSHDGHVGPDSVSTTVSVAFHRRGYDITAHQLRHWFGTWCQRTGKDVRVTQELMRHKSLNSTQIYTKVSSLAKVEIVRRLEA